MEAAIENGVEFGTWVSQAMSATFNKKELGPKRKEMIKNNNRNISLKENKNRVFCFVLYLKSHCLSLIDSLKEMMNGKKWTEEKRNREQIAIYAIMTCLRHLKKCFFLKPLFPPTLNSLPVGPSPLITDRRRNPSSHF